MVLLIINKHIKGMSEYPLPLLSFFFSAKDTRGTACSRKFSLLSILRQPLSSCLSLMSILYIPAFSLLYISMSLWVVSSFFYPVESTLKLFTVRIRLSFSKCYPSLPPLNHCRQWHHVCVSLNKIFLMVLNIRYVFLKAVIYAFNVYQILLF